MPIDKVILPEDAKSEDQELSSTLTKAAHRNPDIHERGDTLPESLLEYQEGSATLFPDIAGNTPRLERSKQLILGNSISQNFTTTETQLGNLTASVSCPPQAGIGAFVKVKYNVQLAAVFVGALPAGFAWVAVFVNGLAPAGVNNRSYWQRHDAGPAGSAIIFHLDEEIEVSINPGQTLAINVVGAQSAAPGTVSYNWSVNTGSDRCALHTTLVY